MSDVIASDELRLLIERAERMNEEIKGVQDTRKDIFAEAKSRGFDVKAMKRMIKLRAMERNARAEQDAIDGTYRAALNL